MTIARTTTFNIDPLYRSSYSVTSAARQFASYLRTRAQLPSASGPSG